MISVWIVSHGNLAAAMLESAQMIVGKQPDAVAFCFDPSQAPETLQQQLREALAGVDARQVLVFTDIRSGTPFNAAGSLMQEYGFGHICGVNLALLIEALTQRQELAIDDLRGHLMALSELTILDVNALMAEEEV